jgi:hypothetical protein
MNVHLLTSNESKSTAVSTIQEQLLSEIKGHVVCKNLVEVTKGSEQTLWMARDATLAFGPTGPILRVAQPIQAFPRL